MLIRESACRGEKEPLAIIGIGCRFPGGVKDPESFWQLMSHGVDAITEIPEDRWNIKKYYHPEPGMPGKTYSRWGGFIPGIQHFEPECFGISPREAAFMDPQQRLLLEVAWEAFEDGGQVIEQLGGTKTGVFVGISTADYSQIMTSPRDGGVVDAHVATGGATSIAANRISYCFDLRGPSVAVDTACSSSLVAAHLACQSIWRGECAMALAGGVNVIVTPGCFIAFSAASMLSPDGRCQAFDAGANGFVRSEGAGAVLLKPLTKALADGDSIYCLILGSAVNQDGRTSGISAPSRTAQEELVREACRQAGIDPHEIDYVEAHGTGTKVGDPIEASALGTVLSAGRPKDQYCLMGSVKTNIGHLEAAAGIAGMIKVALALQKRRIPANLHFRDPNPDIPFEDLQLRVPCSLESWPQDSGPAIAGVNSFGFGGTNAHVVMQEYCQEAEGSDATTKDGAPEVLLLPLSARSPEALQTLLRSYEALLGSDDEHQAVSLSDLCYTASVRRTHFDHRLSLVVHNREELCEHLNAFLAGERRPGTFAGHRAYGKTPRLAFVFSGQGPQWWGMGRQLLEQESVFRRAIEECDALLGKYANWSLWQELTADEHRSRLQETAIAQPALFALQVALAALWKSWGVEPQAVVGHSVGEVAAAYLAGALSLEQAARVIFHRGRCMDLASSRGRMLAVGLSLTEAEEAIRGYEDRVALAATNSPSSVTLSADPQALEQICQTLDQKGIFCRFLKVNYAFHSQQMDPIKDELLHALEGLDPKAPVLPIISTVTGNPSQSQQWDAEYWWHNVRERVRFAEAVDELITQGYDVFLELSPHPALSGAVSECLLHRGVKGTVLPSLRRQEEEKALMLASLGALYTVGHPVDWRRLWSHKGRCLHLPTYPWQRQSYWHESEDIRELRLGADQPPLLGQKQRSAEPTWEMAADRRLLRYLDDHKVHEHVVLPAAAYVEMALEAARENLPAARVLVLEDLQFQRALFLPDNPPIVQFIFNPADDSFAIHSTTSRSDQAWVLHAIGYMRSDGAVAASEKADVQGLMRDLPEEVASTEVYRMFAEVGLHFGPAFQGIERVWRTDEEALGRGRLPEALAPESERYCFHPTLLDACFQVLSQALPQQQAAHKALYLPVQIERVRFYRSPGPQVWSHVRLTRKSARMIEGDLRLYDEDGNLLTAIEGFRCQAVESTRSGTSKDLEQWFYETKWYHRPLVQQLPAQRSAQYFPAVQEVARSITAEMRRVDEEMGWPALIPEAQKALNTVATAYIAQALYDLGWRGQAGDGITLDALMEQLDVASQHRQILRRFLDMLGQAGFLRPAGTDAWVIDQTLAELTPQKLWRQVLSRYPAFLAELSLIHACGSRLPAVLRGQQDPLQLLFPAGSTTTAEHFYQDSLSFRPYNLRVQKAIAQILRHLPEGRTIRVLEVGAGTGGTTSYIAPLLPAGRTEYVFSDVTPFFFQKAEQKLRSYPFVQFRLLDIEKDPVEQGYEAHAFDLILVSNVLHATAHLRAALSNTLKLLSSEGILILLEVEDTPPFWVDAVFGLTDGWWRFQDFDLRPTYALISRDAWRDVLQESGFPDVAHIDHPRDQGDSRQVVMLARGPRIQTQGIEQEAEPTPEEKGYWLMFADSGGIAQRLAEQLSVRGDACLLVTPGNGFQQLSKTHFHVAPDNPESTEQLLRAVFAQHEATPWHGVVHLWSLDVPPLESTSTVALRQAESLGCHSVLHLMQALYRTESPASIPRLILVTRGAQPVGRGEVALAQTPLVGLGRTLINEHPDIRCKLIDLDPDRSGDEVAFLLAELQSGDAEEEVALRQATRWVPRLERVEQEKAPACRYGRAFRLEIPTPGVMDHLSLRETMRSKPAPGQVEIEVHAASLNFRDVMKALGLYPAESDDALLLGDECAGRIVAVGEGVNEWKVGDEVVAVAPSSFGSHVIALAGLVARKPKSMSFEEAATLPIAFLTAYYALHYLARLRAGERVLIQSGAGGVGLAAVQIAQQAGAEVFATAGSPEKREVLQLLGVPHVMDSRSLSFADQVMEITRGQGVDVVLNSLAGKAIGKGVSCLAPYGRFLELGKRDIYQNSKLGLWPFRKNVSFFAIDLGGLVGEKSPLAHTLLNELWQRVEDGTFRPLPHRVFPVSRLADAFRHMAQARHVGKIVISMREQDILVEPLERARIAFRSDATYLITGGLGGLGLRLAQWIVEHGGCNLVLMGRSGAVSEEAQKILEDLERAGARVMVAKADVGREDQVTEVLAKIDRTMPPLKGIFHAAMVLDDGIVLQLDRERFRKVMAPKVDGAWHLHRQTLHKGLDFFVLFSSSSSLVGNPGQANYVAANVFLDALAHYRHALALPATTINFGLIRDVGYAARNENVAEMLERHGVLGISSRQALEALGRILQKKSTQTGVLRFDWPTLAKFMPQQKFPQRLALLAATGNAEQAAGGEGERIREMLLQAKPDEREELARDYLLQQVAKALGAATDKLDMDRPLNEMGFDSLMAVELKNRVESDLALSLPTRELMQAPTVNRLLKVVLTQLGGSARTTERTFVSTTVSARSSLVVDSLQSCLVPLRAQGSRLPLFCLHPAGGQVNIYRNLSELLPADQPVYGIQSRLLTGAGEEHSSLADMALHYAQIIRQLQAHGPYYLLGFSLGGFLAMAIANILERQGQTAAFVGLVDCDARWTDPLFPQHLILHDRIVGMYGVLQRDLHILHPLAEDYIDELSDIILSSEPNQRADGVIKWLRERKYLKENVPLEAIKDYLSGLLSRFETHMNLIVGFQPLQIQAPLFVWWAHENQRDDGAANKSWSGYSREGVVEEILPGDHYEVMYPPVVVRLAEQLDRILRAKQISQSA